LESASPRDTTPSRAEMVAVKPPTDRFVKSVASTSKYGNSKGRSPVSAGELTAPAPQGEAGWPALSMDAVAASATSIAAATDADGTSKQWRSPPNPRGGKVGWGGARFRGVSCAAIAASGGRGADACSSSGGGALSAAVTGQSYYYDYSDGWWNELVLAAHAVLPTALTVAKRAAKRAREASAAGLESGDESFVGVGTRTFNLPRWCSQFRCRRC
jgi:hypothetical protein